MPLPDSAPLSLQVNANAVESRPKHAMIVRMSAETLDALADALPNCPPVAFDFGDHPGIYIGDAFFPVRPQSESSPHELYLRAASAAKPMAPLKLYANVIGKFMVERQLGDKVTDKVRQQTMVAKQQHQERQAILLEQPPISAPAKNGKRKLPGSGTVLNKSAPSDSLHLASRKVSPLPPAKASPDVRRRLVHFLAVAPRHADDVVKMVGGSITASAREDLLTLLHDVAEEQPPSKKGDTSPRPWQLKTQTWTEVRPYEWPKLSETDRTAMARQARLAFKALKIPESDPAWENVRYRAAAPSVPAPPPMATSSSSRSTTSTPAEPKRPAITTKEAKSKSKQDPPRAKGEIQMKDESAKATVSRVNAIKRAEIDRPPSPSQGSTAAKAVASRRLPGSGYQKKASLPPAGSAEKSATHATPKTSLSASLPPKPSPSASPAGANHARKTIPTVPPKQLKKEDESDREHERQRERERERDRREREKEKEKEKEKQREEWEREQMELEKREKAKQRQREAIEREKRQREKERERQELRQREKERLAKERAAASTAQRKAAADDDALDDTSHKAPLPKRRKLDDGSSMPTSTPRDVGSTSKKQAHDPSPAPRLKIKKDRPSPQPSTSNQERRAIALASGSTHKSERPLKTSGSAKPRRRSPIYTSSEDEGEIPQPRKRNPSPLPISDRSNSSDQPVLEKVQRHHRPPRARYPPANDHAALRALYQSQYADYLGTFGKIVAQKRKIEAMLNGDVDAEVDMMDPDDLMKLTIEHRTLKTELENIHDIYTKGTTITTTAITATRGSGSTSD